MKPRPARLLARLLPLLTAAAAFCAQPAFAAPPDYVPDQVLVKFRPAAARADREVLLREIGESTVRELRPLDVQVLRLAPGADGADPVPAALARWRGHPLVEYIEPNWILSGCVLPDDPLLPDQWHLFNDGADGGVAGADVGAALGWDVAVDARPVVVAVLDSGVDYTHPDLAANMWDGGPGLPHHGWDVVANDDDPMDEYGHGTHVAGLIGAVGGNGRGGAGVCWNVRLMAIRILDGANRGRLDDIVLGVLLAVGWGADVLNNSYGDAGEYSQTFRDAVAYAADRGVLFVAAAGNDAVDNDLVPFYPADYDLPNVVSVGGTDRRDELAEWSNYGAASVDLAAPGDGIFSTGWPGHGYRTISGTSMAAPQVSGAAALIRARHPEVDLDTWRAWLLAGAEPLPSLQRRTVTGGRLDLGRALAAADLTPPSPVDDLRAEAVSPWRVLLTWTAPGDLGGLPAPARYEIRRSDGPLDAANFDAAILVPAPPTPSAAGAPETLSVGGLEPGATLSFALRAIDAAGNAAPLSNVVTALTPPAASLQVSGPDLAADLPTGTAREFPLVVRNPGPGPMAWVVRAVGFPAVSASEAAPSSSSRPAASAPRPRASVSVDRLRLRTPGAAPADLVALAEGAGVGLVFSDDVESGPGGWTGDGDGFALWNLSRDAYGSPFVSWRCGFAGTGYATGDSVDAALVSPTIDLGRVDGTATLEFLEWFVTEPDRDFCRVEAAAPGDPSWTPLRAPVSGDGGGWALRALDLTPWVGGPVRVRFRLTAADALVNDLPGWFVDDVRVVAGGCSWLVPDRNSGLLAAGAVDTLRVRLDAGGLCGGRRYGQLEFAFADPDAPAVLLPAALDVSAAPDLDLDAAALDLGPVFVGAERRAFVTVTNAGCLDLVVTGVESEGEGFATTDGSAFSLPPGGARALDVVFAPIVPGAAAGALRLFSTDPDASITALPLSGAGLEPPFPVLVDPEPGCSAVSSAIVDPGVLLRNDGASPLRWSLAGPLPPEPEGVLPAPPPPPAVGEDLRGRRILWLRRHSEMPSLGSIRFVEDMRDRGAEVVETSAVVTAELLAGADLALVVGGSLWNAVERDALAVWLRGGGGLLIVARLQSSIAAANDILGAAGAGLGYGWPGGVVGPGEPVTSHAVLAGVRDIELSQNDGWLAVDWPGRPLLRDPGGRLAAAISLPGRGRIVALASLTPLDFAIDAGDNRRFMNNIVDWLSARWLRATALEGVVPAGDAVVLPLRVDTGGLVAGAHVDTLVLHTNAPDAPTLPLPVRVDVRGVPKLVVDGLNLEDEVVDFGPAGLDEALDRDLVLRNHGTGDLHLLDLAADGAGFGIALRDPAPVLAPGDSVTATLRFRPEVLGPHLGGLELGTDDPRLLRRRIWLSGLGLTPAQIAVGPDSLVAELYTAGISRILLTFTNTGGAPLRLTLAPTVAWIIPQATTLDVPGGEARQLYAAIYAYEMGDGDYTGALRIGTNVPERPVVVLPARLRVFNAPDLVVVPSFVEFPPTMIYEEAYEHVYLQNHGSVRLDIEWPPQVDSPYLEVLGPDVPYMWVPPGEAMVFYLRYRPLEPDILDAVMRIRSNDPYEPVVEVLVSGETIYRPQKEGPEKLVNVPNPFNPLTELRFTLPAAGRAEVRIYDLRGRLVRRLDAGARPEGPGALSWDGRGDDGASASSGTYLARLLLDGRPLGEPRRMKLLR